MIQCDISEIWPNRVVSAGNVSKQTIKASKASQDLTCSSRSIHQAHTAWPTNARATQTPKGLNGAKLVGTKSFSNSA